MIREIAVVAMAATLAGCMDPPSEWRSTRFEMKAIPGYADCALTRINTGDKHIYAIRCPNSTTTTSTLDGKVHMNTTVIDTTTTPAVPHELVAATRKETLQCEVTPQLPSVLTCTRQTGE